MRRRLCTSVSQHPLIDVSALATGCSSTVKRLRSALFDRGYFYAAGVSDLPASYIKSIYEYSARAHALPASVKLRCAQRSGTGSYSGLDIGQPELNYEATDAVASVSGWDFSRQRFSLGNSDATTPIGDLYPGVSDGLDPPFATVMDDLYERQDRLGRVLLRGFEEALDLPQRTLLDLYEQGGDSDFGTIRLLQYPGDEAAGEKATTGIGAHTDFEVFTLMHQNASGLQFMPRIPGVEGVHGDWVDAPVRDEEFVVILGDMLERLTNGALLATPHRVLPTPHARSSIIRFNGFAPEALVQPLDAFCSAERPPMYSPVTMRQHSETTMKNLEAGLGSWDTDARRSRSATYDYSGTSSARATGAAPTG